MRERRAEKKDVSVTSRLSRVAERQQGLVTTADAKRLGIDSSALRKLDGKTLERRAPGIYQVVSFPRTREGDLRAALLVGELRYSRRNVARPCFPIVASHQSALALHGRRGHPRIPTITVPRKYRRYTEDEASVIVEHADMTADETCKVNGIASVSEAVALAQVASANAKDARFAKWRHVAQATRPDGAHRDWTEQLTIDTVATQLASVKPSLAPGRLRVLVNSIGECANAFSSGDVDWLNETIEQATAAIGQWHFDDQQLHLFE